jgi:hypothetical protein
LQSSPDPQPEDKDGISAASCYSYRAFAGVALQEKSGILLYVEKALKIGGRLYSLRRGNLPD